ncbi:ankyrin repeat domain-containing protein [Dactylosporangium sp. NPDC048998]|uniref:ankyrin repeat domain-containing protein n=1 Tax=Dactylosporangium sp. NPDC048998 TaxID=3363976 RepID=UPI003722E079
MIERATQRRLAGDWRGACAAVNVDADFDLRAVRRMHGAEVAERVEDDLRHLAPDLLRWHLPRRPRDGLLRGGLWFPLDLLPEDHALVARAPVWHDRPQRITLRVEHLDRTSPGRRDDELLHLRDRWDSRCTGGMLSRCGGVQRLPFFAADGERLPEERLGGAGPEGLVERLVRLDDGGRHAAAWAAAGFRLDVLLFDPRWGRDLVDPAAFDPWLPTGRRNHVRGEVVRRSLAWLRPIHPTLTEAARGVQGLARIDMRGRCLVLDGRRVRLVTRVPYGRVDEERRRAEVAEFGVELARIPRIPDVLARRPAELDALVQGRLGPDDLHPLVRAALFPGRPAPVPAPLPVLRETVRVHCDHATHEVAMRDGAVVLPHTPAEIARERMIQALGGEVQGCVAAYDGWRNPAVRMPRPMRTLRDDLMTLIRRGDARAVAAALDRGLDPHVRDERGRTLLHLLPWLHGADLLPRLLAAGLDIAARDERGETPLHAAVDHGTAELVTALVAAGADPRARANGTYGRMPLHTNRPELAFLRRSP